MPPSSPPGPARPPASARTPTPRRTCGSAVTPTRWFVELAQNAADAARAAGVPGRVCVELRDGELRVANTGAPLDAAGVAALASLRASAKRDDSGSVGRFGVGFAAVLTVSDAPRVLSTGGGVAFSAARTAAEVAALPGAAAELARRDGPPVLRLRVADRRAPARRLRHRGAAAAATRNRRRRAARRGPRRRSRPAARAARPRRDRHRRAGRAPGGRGRRPAR